MDIEWIKEQLKKQGKAKSALAAHLGIQPSGVTSLLRGERHIKLAEAQKIAEFFGVRADISSEDVAADLDKEPAKTVKIKGYVGAGSEAHFYALSDEDFEPVEAPEGASDQTIAVEIKGKSWGPLMDSWLVFYDDIRSPITEDLFGKPCVVGLADDRILLKTIKRERDGSYTLLSNSTTEPPIENVEIEWAAKVIGMRPR